MNRIIKISALLFLLIIIPMNSFSKENVTTWAKTLDSFIYTIKQTQDAGYIAVGYTEVDSDNQSSVIWVAKLDKNGEIKWQKNYPGSKNYNSNTKYIRSEASDVIETSDGGYILLSNTRGLGNDGFYPVGYCVFKINDNGDIIWEFKGYENEGIAQSISKTSDGGFILALFSEPDLVILKFDDIGTVTWKKSYETTVRGVGMFYAYYSIEQTQDGGYIVAGGIFDDSGEIPWVLKLNKSGNEEWSKIFNARNHLLIFHLIETAKSKAAWADSILQTNDGGYIVAITEGRITIDYMNYSNSNIRTVKLDQNGNIIWDKRFKGDVKSVVPGKTDGWVIAGNTNTLPSKRSKSKYKILKIDSNRRKIWTRIYSFTEYSCLLSMQQARDSGYIVSGVVNISDNTTRSWILKLDENGNCDGPGCP